MIIVGLGRNCGRTPSASLRLCANLLFLFFSEPPRRRVAPC